MSEKMYDIVNTGKTWVSTGSFFIPGLSRVLCVPESSIDQGTRDIADSSTSLVIVPHGEGESVLENARKSKTKPPRKPDPKSEFPSASPDESAFVKRDEPEPDPVQVEVESETDTESMGENDVEPVTVDNSDKPVESFNDNIITTAKCCGKTARGSNCKNDARDGFLTCAKHKKQENAIRAERGYTE